MFNNKIFEVLPWINAVCCHILLFLSSWSHFLNILNNVFSTSSLLTNQLYTYIIYINRNIVRNGVSVSNHNLGCLCILRYVVSYGSSISILALAARFYKGTGYIEYPAKMNAISIHYRTLFLYTIGPTTSFNMVWRFIIKKFCSCFNWLKINFINKPCYGWTGVTYERPMVTFQLHDFTISKRGRIVKLWNHEILKRNS